MTHPLFQPLTLPAGATIKNRFFKSAMSEGLGTPDHRPTPLHVTLYRRWAEGGAGLVVTGNIMIDRRAIGEPRNVVVEDERDFSLLKQWASAGTKNGTHLWAQLNHPGKQIPKYLVKEPVAPSAIPLQGNVENFFAKPRALTSTEIVEIIHRFGNSARILQRAGFTGIQIHAAHGYLISQFLSAHHNQRDDEWGGSLTNRMRFLVEVYQEIRKQVGDSFPIGIKLNSADFQRGGLTEEESMTVIQKLSTMNIDCIEISGGNYENPAMFLGSDIKESTRKREAYFIDFAEQARDHVTTPLVVTGGFRSEEGMTQAIDSHAIDMVGLARPFSIKPDLPNQINQGSYHTTSLKRIRTGISSIDESSLLDTLWYEQQLKRLGKGKKPLRRYPSFLFFIQTLLSQGILTLQRRRS
ncbi:NADH:flavin oxidoreductase/NADH oxidase family protein [Marininema halotolerans]|nr:NADH:flavin oxidoreductase/NADH oxidase family protein [Marininema halotolerans]